MDRYTHQRLILVTFAKDFEISVRSMIGEKYFFRVMSSCWMINDRDSVECLPTYLLSRSLDFFSWFLTYPNFVISLI